MDWPRHYEESAVISATPKEVFNYIDNHTRFSSHMNKGSLMMGGGKMETRVDEEKGQKVGSHIKMSGKIIGIDLFLDEVVTKREPPNLKVWETVGIPKLLVIGNYQMGVEINSQNKDSNLKVFIDYELPKGKNSLLGYLFGDMYAKWCVRQMLSGTREEFNTKKN